MINQILKELKFLAEEIIKAPYSIDSSKIIEKINLLEEKLIIHKFLLDNNKFQKENTVDHKKIEQDIFLDSEIIPEFVKKENTEKLNNIKEKKINDLFGKDFNNLSTPLLIIKTLFLFSVIPSRNCFLMNALTQNTALTFFKICTLSLIVFEPDIV